MKKNFFLGFIPARKGSQGIKNKNIILLKKKKLIEYSIKSSVKSRLIDQTFVSTDDQRILNLSNTFKKVNFYKRLKSLSSSKSLMKDVIINFINKHKRNYSLNNLNIVVLQPTSPLRNSKDIDDAISFFLKKKAKFLVSVSDPMSHPEDIVFENKKNVSKLISSQKEKNRQNFKKFYYINGSIFIINASSFLKSKKFINKNTLLFKMKKKHSIEIDDLIDLKLVKALI